MVIAAKWPLKIGERKRIIRGIRWENEIHEAGSDRSRAAGDHGRCLCGLHLLLAEGHRRPRLLAF
jgi:hypothetical protein